MLLVIPTLGENEDVSVSWTKLSSFLQRRGKINGYLQFVETQSILCGSYPLNGDEGTITEYGHFRVTADFERWPLVEVFVLDPECCAVYWFHILFNSLVSFTQRRGKSPLHGCLSFSLTINSLYSLSFDNINLTSAKNVPQVYIEHIFHGFPLLKSWKYVEVKASLNRLISH